MNGLSGESGKRSGWKRLLNVARWPRRRVNRAGGLVVTALLAGGLAAGVFVWPPLAAPVLVAGILLGPAYHDLVWRQLVTQEHNRQDDDWGVDSTRS